MHDFDYAAPTTLGELLQLNAERNGQAKLLAGGTDLIDHIRTGRLTPEIVIDVKKVPELNALEVSNAGLRLGAAVPCYRVYESPEICEHYAALADSCRIIGGVQIQSRASVGGNLCNSGPAADTTPALIALNATCLIAGPKGEREIPAHEFCTGPGRNVLQTGELLVEMRFPKPPAGSGSHYRRFIPRNEMDIAVIGVGAAVTLDDAKETIKEARIALGAVGPTPIFAEEASNALSGQPISDDALREAAENAKAVISPIDDMRGTIAFRQHVTGVLTERVLKLAIQRVKESS